MLTQDRLRQLLDYNPLTGEFRWRVDRGGRAASGSIAGALRVRRGHRDQAQRQIDVDGRRYPAGRLAWLYVYGTWPKLHVDHINGDQNDNRIANLREATNQQNHGNMRRSRNNSTGLKGTSLHLCGKYSAQITVNGRKLHLGLFNDLAAAHAAYRTAAEKHFGRFARFD